MSLWGGSIRFTPPMLFALAFLPMFGIGGLTGLPLGLASPDIHFHDTYYVIAHFHYVVAPGTLFALFAGIYYWYPKATGRYMSTTLGHLHFWPSLLFINGVFMPMFIQGMAGMQRRLYDGGASYTHTAHVLWLHKVISFSAWGLALAQIPFIINFFWSIWKGKKVGANPWEATTLEWAAAPSPPIPDGPGVLRARVQGDERLLGAMLVNLVRSEVPVYSFHEEVSDLEDIFLRTTRGLVQ